VNSLRSILAALLALPAAAQEHRFEADPVATVRENFVACDVLSQLQRVMDNRVPCSPVIQARTHALSQCLAEWTALFLRPMLA
jgi:hypothetical protein